jgi:hypothetical protein
MREKYSEEIEVYSDLTSEQQELKVEVDAIMERFEKELSEKKDKELKELHQDKKEEIQSFVFKMESKDSSPLKYVLGRRLLGLDADDSITAFDTENGDIYDFIKSLEDGPEKIMKLFGWMSEVAKSFNLESKADEIHDSINYFKDGLEEKNIAKYVYGEILLHPDKIIDINASDYIGYDIDGGKIEKKIRELYKEITV